MDELQLEFWHGLMGAALVAAQHYGRQGYNAIQNYRKVPRRNGDNGTRCDYITRDDFTEYKKYIEEELTKIKTKQTTDNEKLDGKLDELLIKVEILLDRDKRKVKDEK